ncbi:MAG: PDZ domain-containing protein, partial [Planctomycetes bacterium]|nr:PDZ domain-containing protein [Planctomycetota bacterium]
LVLFLAPLLTAQTPEATPFQASLANQLAWRNLGPANPMGRMTDLDVHPLRQATWFVGTAGGGLWKTTNAGTTWACVFDREGSVSIGDVAIAPSDPELVWVGTGEENARNSVQWGDGVYKSTDGGASWSHMGLRATFQIGHIAIHPKNPDVVYVAALGSLWGDNDERGVYRTRNGGATWERVLFLDAKTGCIDVRLHPDDPNTVFACMYERRRDGFDGNDPSVRFGPKSGLYKSTDGGDNWRELTTGLPTCPWGRSGIDILASRPDTMFAIVETERSGWAKGDRKDFLPGEEPPRPGPGQGPGAGGPPSPPVGEGTQPTQQEEGQQPQRPQGAPAQGQGPGGRGARADLGVGLEGDDGKADTPGAILRQVTENGVAAKAGLLAGDRITKVGDEAVKTYADLAEIVRDSRAGQKAVLTFVRGTEEKTVEVTYGERQGGFNQAMGRPNGPFSGRLFGQDANVQERQGELGFETGGVFRSDDRGENWRRVNSLNERPFYYSVIRVDPRSDQNVYCVGTNLWGTRDGGKEFKAINVDIHVDFHGIWCDPDCADHLLAVCDGGINETFDRGKSWQVHRGFCAAQYYDVVADNSVPYNVVGGLQDNGTWVVPSRTRWRDGIGTEDCYTIYGGDGFGAQTDPLEPWIVYCTSQNGALGVVDLRTGQQARVQRDRVPGGGQAAFNWDAPFVLSPHNRLTVWHAGNFVWRGERYAHLDNRAARPAQGAIRGNDALRMKCVSGKLGRTDAGTAVSIAESPRVQGLLYVGTDDGALWRSEDGAVTWNRIDQNLPVVAPRYVSDLVPSHFADNRVYLTLDGHRSDDFATYVFVSDDRGNTWRDLGLDLPSREPCYAVLEDPRNEDLLYLGTEYGAHVSFDRGDRWFPLGRNLPTVAVRDLFVQDRDSDLVAATHGRGVWVLDCEALRQVTKAVAKKPAHLFAVEPAILWRMTSRGFQGNKQYSAPNPAYGVTFHVWLAEPPKGAPLLTIHDVTGEKIAEVEGKAVAGLQPIVWDCRVGGQRLARPGTYAVRWPDQKDAEARAFTLSADPKHSADEAGAAATEKE